MRPSTQSNGIPWRWTQLLCQTTGEASADLRPGSSVERASPLAGFRYGHSPTIMSSSASVSDQASLPTEVAHYPQSMPALPLRGSREGGLGAELEVAFSSSWEPRRSATGVSAKGSGLSELVPCCFRRVDIRRLMLQGQGSEQAKIQPPRAHWPLASIGLDPQNPTTEVQWGPA